MNEDNAPPEEFWEDYVQVRTHLEWVEAGMGGGAVDIPQVRLVAEAFGEFVTKWHGRIRDADVAASVARFAAWRDKMARTLELIYLEQLHTVLERRRDWIVSEMFIGLAVNFIELMKHAPPEMRPELEKIYREHMGEEYDPAKDFRDTEKSIEQSEADFRKELAKLEIEWPERVDAAMRERLIKVDDPELADWQKEVAEKLSVVPPTAT